jgi:hypothetical protein
MASQTGPSHAAPSHAKGGIIHGSGGVAHSQPGANVTDRNPLAALNPNAIFSKLEELADEWVEADSAASLYEETRKPLLARIALEHIEARGGSQARADAAALASEEYRNHVTTMVARRKSALRLKIRYENAKIWADHARSANANRRAELQLGGLAS